MTENINSTKVWEVLHDQFLVEMLVAELGRDSIARSLSGLLLD